MRVLIYDGSISKKGKDIYGVRDRVPDCRFAKDAIAVSSLSDMVEQIKAKRHHTGELVNTLTCCGHAAPGSLAVAGIIDPQTNEHRMTYDPHDDLEYRGGDVQGPFKALQPLLAPGAFFLLAGCGVAEEEKGEKLLETISQKLPGVWVVGIHTDMCIINNDNENRVEVHYAMNQQDKGLLDPLSIKVAHKGKMVDEDDWPDDLINHIALWPS